MNATIKVSSGSLTAFSQNLLRAQNAVRAEAANCLDELTQQLFDIAQTKVPRVTGALADSGVIVKQGNQYEIRRTIGYGNQSTNPVTGDTTASYAVDRHESFNPNKPEAYKWLERTMRDQGSTVFRDKLIAAMASALRR